MSTKNHIKQSIILFLKSDLLTFSLFVYLSYTVVVTVKATGLFISLSWKGMNVVSLEIHDQNNVSVATLHWNRCFCLAGNKPYANLIRMC